VGQDLFALSFSALALALLNTTTYHRVKHYNKWYLLDNAKGVHNGLYWHLWHQKQPMAFVW
jgi:hypothetical protein